MWTVRSHRRLLKCCVLISAGVCALPLFLSAQVQGRRRPLDPIEIRYYSKARSVLDWSPAELVHAIPELKKLQFDISQKKLPLILANVGNNVAGFFRNFPNTTSIEQVQEEVLRENGTIAQQKLQRFHYLILADHQSGGPNLEEYRTDNRGNRIDVQSLTGGFLLTQGFAADSIFFDKAFQPNSRFRYLGQDKIGKRETDVVAFAQNPRARPVVELAQMGNQSAIILVQGLAWIDAATYQIVRLRTDLLAPPPLLDLAKQSTQIQYAQVRFKQVADILWLPREVRVTVVWNGQTFRNVSSYSKYQLFKVNTKLQM
jgi:hypothetical protein